MNKKLYYSGMVAGGLAAALGFTGMMGEALVERNRPAPLEIQGPISNDTSLEVQLGMHWEAPLQRIYDRNTFVSYLLEVDVEEIEDCRRNQHFEGWQETACNTPTETKITGNPSELARNIASSSSTAEDLVLFGLLFSLGLIAASVTYIFSKEP